MIPSPDPIWPKLTESGPTTQEITLKEELTTTHKHKAEYLASGF
jgi:hypothetical protein